MKIFKSQVSPEQINLILNGTLIIRSSVTLNSIATLEDANQTTVCFFENEKYLPDLKSTKAGLVLVPLDFDENQVPDINVLKVSKPYVYFMMLAKHLMESEELEFIHKVSKNAHIADNSKIVTPVKIDENVVIGENSKIDSFTKILSNVVIGDNVEIGKNCFIFPNVTIYNDTKIGNNVIIHSGSVIGADGFGYILHEGIQQKIPQVGNVVIEDNVEIGANTTIDRGTLGSTIIGEGSKIDNLVQIGHNCKIGKHNILCAQVGLAGSSETGDYVYLGGQVGLAGHLRIGDKAMVAAQSGVSGNIEPGHIVLGTPAIDAGLKKRIIASEKKLPELVKFMRQTQKEK
ncbi:MAG: UDP-3-O-(3-hydroxymyristoyl)glucosamine N-acyltransferase [Candidatus Cloacimonetes bacterium]|nr:UDP-3-O-(3-hydroxymyristoyl)glucosamine N-acyltransferase [Candidatus Cloacimonadota bacterium]